MFEDGLLILAAAEAGDEGALETVARDGAAEVARLAERVAQPRLVKRLGEGEGVARRGSVRGCAREKTPCRNGPTEHGQSHSRRLARARALHLRVWDPSDPFALA